jgi:hypothetical protein
MFERFDDERPKYGPAPPAQQRLMTVTVLRPSQVDHRWLFGLTELDLLELLYRGISFIDINM